MRAIWTELGTMWAHRREACQQARIAAREFPNAWRRSDRHQKITALSILGLCGAIIAATLIGGL